MTPEPCLYAGNHVRAPKGTAEWHAWAKEMRLTHVQLCCPGCNQWVVWKPKEKA